MEQLSGDYDPRERRGKRGKCNGERNFTKQLWVRVVERDHIGEHSELRVQLGVGFETDHLIEVQFHS